MVRIRLSRVGRHHRQVFRLVACSSRSPRDGKAIEILGHYDPAEADEAKKLTINEDRIRHWIGVGAQPSDRVWTMLRKKGINKANTKPVAVKA